MKWTEVKWHDVPGTGSPEEAFVNGYTLRVQGAPPYVSWAVWTGPGENDLVLRVDSAATGNEAKRRAIANANMRKPR